MSTRLAVSLAVAVLNCSIFAWAQLPPSISEYSILTGSSNANVITSGPDGALWFTELEGNKIGRITTAGAFTECPIPGFVQIQGIAAGWDGALWFTEFESNRVGRITTAGVFNEFTILTAGSGPHLLTTGPDGALWITQFTNKIARDTLPVARPSIQPTSGSALNQMLTVRFSDSPGATNIGVVDVSINNALDGQNACYLAYVPSSNTLYLVDDGGDTLTLNIFFEESFLVNHVLYAAARDTGGGNNTGWQALGTWSVQ